MVKKLFTIFLLGLFCMTATAGERYLVRIGADGKQEAIPLKKGERAQDAISRLENSRTSLLSKSSSPNGLIDSLKHYPGDANSAAVLTTNFGWTHQDVAFVWYVPAAGGKVKELWWLNYSLQGDIKKGTVRAWVVDPKLATRPASVASKHLGYYADPTDGDGLVTPFKPASGNQWFYGNGLADSATWRFDPLGTEVATWLPGGLQVTLDSGKWQGIKLEDWGDSMFVNLGQMFGFTLSNDTKVSDIPGGTGAGARMELLSWANANPAPYHSFKWYETGRASTTDKGWHLRGDYEWGMYTVIEYTTDRAPAISLVGSYNTTLKTTTRPIEVKVTDDNPGGGAFGVASVYMKTKKGSLASYDSALVSGTGSQYIGTAPAAALGDTVYWQFVATDVNGNRTVFGPRSYVVFKKNQANLLVYNNTTFSLGNSGANLIYTSASPAYDRWSAPNDGTGELDDLLALYSNVLLADGSFPSRNVYPSIKTWFGKGTAQAKKNFFFTSQDFGCYITNTCADTTFGAGSLEFDYLGILTLGPQDLGPTNRPYKVVPLADPITNYLIKYNTDSATTLWHHPTFELTSTYSAYPDGMTPKAGAKAIFTDGAGTNNLGIFNSGATFNSAFVAFDAGALQFRSDTSKAPSADPKYQWIVDIGALSVAFFKATVGVTPNSDVVPGEFALGQNYPNPFNPSTTLEYSIPVRSNVEIAIFNILGQQVATVVNDMHEAGSHRATWNGKDSFGKPVASGIYFYQMRAGSFEKVKKMMLMK